MTVTLGDVVDQQARVRLARGAEVVLDAAVDLGVAGAEPAAAAPGEGLHLLQPSGYLRAARGRADPRRPRRGWARAPRRGRRATSPSRGEPPGARGSGVVRHRRQAGSTPAKETPSGPEAPVNQATPEA